MKKNLSLIVLLACAVLVFVFAGLYGKRNDWANFGMCLTAAVVFLISTLLESQYRRFRRRIDRLEELIRKDKQKPSEGKKDV